MKMFYYLLPVLAFLSSCNSNSCEEELSYNVRFAITESNPVIYQNNPGIEVKFKKGVSYRIIEFKSDVYCLTDATNLYFDDGDDFTALVGNPATLIYSRNGTNYMLISLKSRLQALGRLEVDLVYDNCCVGISIDE